LLKLVPVKIDAWVIWIILLQSPPWSIGSKEILNKWTIVSFSYVKHIGWNMLSYLNF